MTAPIPEELAGRVVAYLLVDGADRAIDFYARAFGAQERYRLVMPDGRVGHAELVLDGAIVFLADASPGAPAGAIDPRSLGGTTVLLHRWVTDVDAACTRALDAGATQLRPPADEFYGDRVAVVADPWGHVWSLHTHVRDMSPDDISAAMTELTGERPV